MELKMKMSVLEYVGLIVVWLLKQSTQLFKFEMLRMFKCQNTILNVTKMYFSFLVPNSKSWRDLNNLMTFAVWKNFYPRVLGLYAVQTLKHVAHGCHNPATSKDFFSHGILTKEQSFSSIQKTFGSQGLYIKDNQNVWACTGMFSLKAFLAVCVPFFPNK